MTYQEPYPMGGTETGGYELVILMRQVQEKRDYAFAESMYGRSEHKKEMRAMVSAYDVVLGLIKALK